MPRGKPGNGAKQRTLGQARRAEEQTRLLPPDLADQILEAAVKERALVLSRIDDIEAALTELDGDLLEARRARRAATRQVWAVPPTTKQDLRGETHATKGRTVGVMTPATIVAGQHERDIAATIATLKKRRQALLAKLAEIRHIERKCREGVISVLLRVTASWRNSIAIGELLPQVKLGSSYFSDAAGNALPPEALGPDGKPLPTPAMPARDNATRLVVEG